MLLLRHVRRCRRCRADVKGSPWTDDGKGIREGDKGGRESTGEAGKGSCLGDISTGESGKGISAGWQCQRINVQCQPKSGPPRC